MGYKESLPSLNSGECNERNKRRYEGFKRMGMHLMPTMDEEKGGFHSIGHKHRVLYRTEHHKVGDSCVHMRLIKWNNLRKRNINKSQVSVLWNCGLWAHI